MARLMRAIQFFILCWATELDGPDKPGHDVLVG
jgi:hypothetical protein